MDQNKADVMKELDEKEVDQVSGGSEVNWPENSPDIQGPVKQEGGKNNDVFTKS